MAEINNSGGNRKDKKVRMKKASLHIDMTPMVDVAFLLITFFMLTTTLQRAKTMNLFLPHDVEDEEQQNKVKESQSLTILLGDEDKLFYYFGVGEDAAKDPVNSLKETTYDLNDGIGKVIDDRAKSVIQASGGRDSIVVVIKPMKESSFENVVNILDNMNIYEIKRYALVEFSKNDKKMIDIKEGKDVAADQSGMQ